MAVASKPDPNKIYIAWQSFTAEGVSEVVQAGMRLRGGHPAVQRCPEYFVADGTPRSEWPSHLDAAVATSANTAALEHAASAKRRPAEIPDDDACEARETFSVSGRTFVAGQRYRRSDPVVKRFPSYFREVGRPLDKVPGA